MQWLKDFFVPSPVKPLFDAESLEQFRVENERAKAAWATRDWEPCGSQVAGVWAFRVQGGVFYRIGENVFFVSCKPSFVQIDRPLV